MPSRRRFIAGSLALALAPAVRAEEDPALWSRLRAGGLVVLVRHAATEPGLGDPRDFKLGDCTTQRNLSEAGRADARRIGERFRAERVAVAQVLTSPWCRCRETAMLAFGEAEDWEPLSSFFDFPHQEPEFTERLKHRIGSYGRRKQDGNLVMVTHNVNIAAISKYSVAPGEMVLMKPDGCGGSRPAGRILV